MLYLAAGLVPRPTLQELETFMVRLILLIGMTGGLLSPLGCGPSGPQKYRVSGTVSFDEQPVEEGEVIFAPVDPTLGPDAGRIVDGVFDLPATAGRKRVQIRASRQVPGETGFRGRPRIESYVPARYDSETMLTAEVSPGGDNHFDFQLHSDPKP